MDAVHSRRIKKARLSKRANPEEETPLSWTTGCTPVADTCAGSHATTVPMAVRLTHYIVSEIIFALFGSTDFNPATVVKR